MLDPIKFCSLLVKNDINFITGVPDSLLKNIICLFQKMKIKNHLSVGNEGIAISLAAGHYLSSGNPALVYMQNSGLGNAVNPLNSLTNKKVYGIPMILLIGWRGEIIKKNLQVKDEPQHLFQGKITLKQLKLMDIPYKIIDKNSNNIGKVVKELKKLAISLQKPVAIVVKKETFKKIIDRTKFNKNKNYPSRQKIIEKIIKNSLSNSVIISNTGYTSRELYQLRFLKNENTCKDFLMVGGMGHAVSVSAGIAKNLEKKKIICIDGDGSLLMHTSAMQNSAMMKNLIHVLINNGVHDSVGAQKINSKNINYQKISEGFGYDFYFKALTLIQLNKVLNKALKMNKSVFIEILSTAGKSNILLRPKEKLLFRKNEFKKFLKKNDYH
jgi:phosphonopyruvate decarboxylase